MKILTNTTHETLYLEFLNDWLIISKMAEHYQMTEKKLIKIIASGKRNHEKRFK